MWDQISSMQIGERSSSHRGICRYHLNQSTKLRHTLRIANHSRHSRTLTRSYTHSHGQQRQRDVHDLHLGSLHSKAVLRVDGCSK